MKYHEICKPPKLTVRRSTVDSMLEDSTLLHRWERAGWVSPIKKANGKGEFDLFSVEALKAAVERMDRGEYLPLS